ncbi:hypothetical protein Plec18167_006345 [Paecilomyces lecythidis]|uniref:Uncharacterized protein n=1 Tax=Paecilomyces lecythidis TaxID=3004212 RepID=A0ABR3XC20_9EURO
MAEVQLQPSGAQSLSTLLENITVCLSSAGSSLPKTKKETPSDVTIDPPQDGISLLDTKSDILLSYIQNLVLLMICQLRELSQNEDDSKSQIDGSGDTSSLRDDIVKKLVELRVYLDRGVRPLEARLKYQVDKVVKAAEDAERAERTSKTTKSRAKKRKTGTDESGSDEDDSDSAASGSKGEEEEDIDEMAYRPNISAFSKSVERSESQPTKATSKPTGDGIYRPPKIKPTALPDLDRRERESRRPRKSNVIDEFVSTEMSSAPTAEPSIGSTIQRGGRSTKTQKERQLETERREYEETNFVRLPKESKKERAKRRAQFGRESGFGGEEWRGLGEGADRIERLTRRAKGSGNVLEKSRKRRLTEDSPRGDGAGIGQTFEKRRKKIESWKR